MKTSTIPPLRFCLLVFCAGLLTSFPVLAGPPVISSVQIEGSEVVVVVDIPEGVRKVTLECRERLGPGSWEPRAVARVDGAGAKVTFRLPVSRAVEVLRVRTDETESLPASFYTGESSFEGAPDLSGGLPTAGPGGVEVLYDTTTTPTEDTAGREVVESDIWKVNGQTLYFFNQYRGLQMIDISDPDHAVLRGALDLPAAGEEMYLHPGGRHVMLLARGGCSYGSGESQVLVLRDAGSGSPLVVASLPVTGSIIESRMVGTALYVASQTYRSVAGANGTTWEWGTIVSGYDLSDPDAPVARNRLWYSGYGNVVASTDALFFVATQDPGNWWQSVVHAIDVTSPDGSMAAYHSIRIEGRVKDKFKLNHDGEVLTTISEDRHWDNGTRLVTSLETFRLPDPRFIGAPGVAKLGELELGQGEQLHATRFDGDKVYIVTFFRIDPLFVVSLKDPSRPRLVGELDVPGWSTYIHPLGDRLVTVGVETNRVAVSLFDVGDPASPSLLSRVLLGEGWSWSEANADEKAFTLLAGEGLILIPYNGYGAEGYASQVQLIDLNRDSLAARGVIAHELQPRRATVYADRILSISGWELMTVDATDRDHPVVTGEVELAWPVDRVFVNGAYLVELATSTWGRQRSPGLRVASVDAPHEVLGGLSLGELPVLGVSARGGYLYVLQGLSGGYPWIGPIPLEEASAEVEADDPPEEPVPNLTLTVIGLENLPALSVVGEAGVRTELSYWGGDLEAVWASEGTLVWVGVQQFWLWYDVARPLAGDALGLAAPWYWGGSGGNLLAFDVSDAAAPEHASEVSLGSDQNWWSFSRAFAADGKIYLSHQTSEYVPVPEEEVSDESVAAPVAGETVVIYPGGRWIRRTFLNVVDYADARHPTVRRPVNIPAALQGISREGALIYTVGPRWSADGTTDWMDYLSVSAYDGVEVHRVDSMPLSSQWPHPVLVEGEQIYVGSPAVADAGGNQTVPALETWTVPDSGKFTRLGIAPLEFSASVLASFPGMLVAQGSDRVVALFDVGDPAQLRWIGGGGPTGCLWFDLKRADGAVGRGLWLPLGVYGIGFIPVVGL